MAVTSPTPLKRVIMVRCIWLRLGQLLRLVVETTAATVEESHSLQIKKYIYYVLNQNDVGTLYEVPFVDGDSQTVVTDVDSPVSFSPDGTHFVFERYDPVHHADLILLGDSESVSILAKVAPPVFLSGKVDWSPDGSAILFGAHDDSAVGAAKTRYGAFLLRDQKIEFGEPPLWSGE